MSGDFTMAVMPAEAYLGVGSQMINIRQEWPDLKTGEVFMRVIVHQRDAEEICRQIMKAAKEARSL